MALFLVSVVMIWWCTSRRWWTLTRRINPEKQGSVYDTKFFEKWVDSCDESEQRQMGQAAFQGLPGGGEHLSVVVGGADRAALRL